MAKVNLTKRTSSYHVHVLRLGTIAVGNRLPALSPRLISRAPASALEKAVTATKEANLTSLCGITNLLRHPSVPGRARNEHFGSDDSLRLGPESSSERNARPAVAHYVCFGCWEEHEKISVSPLNQSMT